MDRLCDWLGRDKIDDPRLTMIDGWEVQLAKQTMWCQSVLSSTMVLLAMIPILHSILTPLFSMILLVPLTYMTLIMVKIFLKTYWILNSNVDLNMKFIQWLQILLNLLWISWGRCLKFLITLELLFLRMVDPSNPLPGRIIIFIDQFFTGLRLSFPLLV